MKRLKPILLLVVVFLAGIVVGATATRVAVKKFVDRVVNRPEAIQRSVERDLTRKLHLRAEQQAKVHDITMRAMEQMKTLRDEFHPRLTEIITRSEQEVRAVLDEEQKQKFDKFVRERAFKTAPRQ
jgi:hypothetical protein